MKQKISAGFTLVELLIVIALISILSVAVLATINPIEQANKAKDSTTQNDAAEVMNSYERYYANAQSYPWMMHADALDVEDALILRSDSVGFGICGLGIGLTGATAADEGTCDTATEVDGTPGLLVTSDELKPSFAGKAEFQTLLTNDENALWLYKAAGSGGSIYVCYIPKAKSNRQQATKLWCLDEASATRCQAGETCGTAGACAALATTDADWGVPDLTGVNAMFMCVPE